MKWEKAFGSLAAATAADGEWTFKRSGFLHPMVSVRGLESSGDIAVFRPDWTGSGTLEFMTGGKKSWKNKNFWRTEWEFQDENGAIMRLKTKPGLIKQNVEVEIIRDLPELTILASLGMYLLKMMHDESAAAAAA